MISLCATTMVCGQHSDAYADRLENASDASQKLSIIAGILAETYKKDDSIYMEYSKKYIRLSKEIIEEQNQQALLENKNESFKNIAILMSFVVILFFGLLLMLRNQKNQLNKKVLQERFSQDLLAYQEVERKRISKDLHDGLGQKLLVIKNKLMISGDIEATKMMDDTIEEIRTITRDLYPFLLQELGITKAIEHTINELDENSGVFISSKIDNIDNLFSKEKEVNIYRIVQEGLSNIVKHAQAKATKLTIIKNPKTIVISIRDNGLGFNFYEKYSQTNTLGLKTLLERTKFLKGQMKVQSKKGNGTLLEFQFPIS